MVGKICKWMGITKSKDRLTIQHRVTIFSSAINNVNKICVWQQQNVLMSYRLVQSPVAITEQFWRIESKCCYLQQTVEPNSQKKSWKKDKDPVEHKYFLNVRHFVWRNHMDGYHWWNNNHRAHQKIRFKNVALKKHSRRKLLSGRIRLIEAGFQ